MAKQLNVNLSFNANTGQAKAQIQSLVSELNKLSDNATLSSKGLPLTRDLIEAQNAAKQLGIALDNAFDVNAGSLDLSAFNQSLRQSGMSLEQYASKLTLLGKEGDQAFLKVAQSIINTQAPLRKTNAMLAEFATTLKNTARWQVSSSILHGFMGAVQSAYGYAQNLNESLNNIRIVTGYNTDQMALFAEQANKAAKALSTTTTKYTDASLIYYQQGLSDSEVNDRTKITTDMANAAGQSAEIVSDQLTAIWNNFYDGSKSLEYYADVLTALGAATASSTDEISAGLQKFAAVAKTVGLSYEYSTAALATITSNTRESADVVGTALKTLFARIQGLQLGETLEDGVDLNKYSEALDKVGISIYDSNGELKTMDETLASMAEKWETLSNTQQVALAQTVAGVRQYTQLVALMENWDNGDADSMTANLNTAYNSTGALSEQADIYAESWEASKDRVTASLEGIYQTLLDDEFFIDINNGFAKLINGVDIFVDSIGGAKGTLLLFGSIMTKMFSDDIAKGINNAIANIRILSGVAQEEISESQKAAKNIAINMTKDMDSDQITAMRQAIETTYSAQEQLRKSAKMMSADQLNVAESAIKTAQSYNEIAIAAGKAADESRRAYEEQSKKFTSSQGTRAANRLDQISTLAVTDTGSDLIKDAQEFINVAKEMGIATDTVSEKIKEYSKAFQEKDETKKTEAINALILAMQKMVEQAQQTSEAMDLYNQNLPTIAKNAVEVRSKFDAMKNSIESGTFEASREDLEKLASELQESGYDVKKFKEQIAAATDDELSAAFTGITFSVEDMNQAIAKAAIEAANLNEKDLTGSMKKLAAAAGDVAIKDHSAAESLKRAGNAAAEAQMKIKNVGLAYQSLGSALGGTLQGITSVASGITSLKSAIDTLNNSDLGTFEKFSSIMMSLGAGLPMLIGGLKNFDNVLKFITSSQKQGLTAQLAYLMGIKTEDMHTKYLIITKTAEGVQRRIVTEAAEAEAAQKAGATVITEIDTAATWKNIAAKMVQYWYIGVIVLALGALAAAIYFAVDAYNEEANAAKRAAEAVDELSESQQELEEKSSKLKSTWDSYDIAVEKLNQCVKGTKEWEAALKDVNNAAMDVLDALPDNLSADEIKSLYDTDKGYMELDANKISEYQAQYNRSAGIAQYASQAGKVSSTRAKVESDTVDAIRDLIATQNSLVMSQASGGYGPVVTSEGDIASYINEDVIKEAILSNISEWTGLEDSKLAEKLEGLGVQTELLSDTTLAKFQSIIEELGETSEAASEKMRLIAKLKVEEEFGDTEDDVTKSITAEVLADRTEELRNAYLKLYTSDSGDVIDFGNGETVTSTGLNKGSNANNAIYQQALEDLKAAGYNYDKAANGVQGNDNNRYFEFTDENGKSVTRTAEWVAETVAAAQALSELSNMAINASEALATMESNVGENESSAIRSMITSGNLNNLNKSDLTALKTIIGGEDSTVSSDEAIDYLRNAFTGYTDDQIAQMFGKDTIQEAGEMWSDVITSTGEKWDQVGSDLVGSVKNTFKQSLDDGVFSEFTLDQTKKVAEAYQEAFDNGGAEGVAILDEMFRNSGDSADELADILVNIDWQTADVESLTQTLEEAGISTEGFADKLAKLIGLMQEGEDVGFDAAADVYANLHDIVNGIKKGDTIDHEDYLALEAAGINVSDFFARTLDGSHELIGDAEEFYNLVNDKSLDIFQSNIAALEEERMQIAALLEKGYTKDTISQSTYTDETEAGMAQEEGLLLDQLTFLDVIGSELENLDSYIATIQEGGELTQEQLQAVQAELEANAGKWDTLPESIEQVNQALGEYYDAMAMASVSMDELNQKLENQEIDAAAYAKALETVAAAEAESYGLDPEKFEDLSEMIEESGSAIAGLSDDLKGNEREANDVAKAILRYDKAVEKVVDKSEDWKKALTSGNLQDQAEAIEELEEAYTNMLDIDLGILSKDFLRNANNLDLMTRAANGSEEAYRELQAIAARDILTQVGLDTTLFEQDMAWLQNVLVDDVAFPDLEVGASLDNTDFLNALTEMVNRTAMTVDQATAYLASMGVDAEVVEETTTTDDKQEHHGFDSTLQRNVAYVRYPIRYGEMAFGTYTAPMITYDEVITPTVSEEISTKENTAVALKVTSANKSSGGGFKHKNSTNASGNGKKSGGGGSKSEKAPTPAKKQAVSKTFDVTDRYHTVNEHIDNVSKAMDKAAKAADRLWGKERLKYLDKQNELLQEEVDLLEAKRQEAMAYLTEDTQALRDAARAAGFEVALDEDGVITNYRSIMDTLAAELIAAETRMNEFATQDEQKDYEETILEPLREKIKELESAIALYEETLGIIEDADAEMEDKMDQIMANNFSKIMDSLEIEITINSSDLELLDYYLNKLEDDVYKMAEAGALMFNPDGNSQLDIYLESLNDYGNAMSELEKAYAAGEITQAAYYEGLAEIQSGLMDNLESVLELDKAMKEYYGDTIKAAQEEISKYTDQMEHQNEVLDYYQSLIELSGKSNDYKMIGKILEGQVKTAKNALEVSKTWYETAKANAESLALQYEQASSEEEREIIKANWEAAQKAADEAQSQMLSDAEAWAEALKAVLENKLADLGKTLEEALTGGSTFENVTTQMDRAVSLQEEYLTATNQIYETNKLMRTAQQEIDRTTNSAAKKRLQAYIKETQQLQDQSKLSSYELEIQQAKYDLLLAEIALEEAKDSKSTVRLQRDSEGNFGYVYTADSNKIAQAQQELEDAQNSLYNIGLEGANDYAQKYQQTMQEMYDTMADIQQQYLEGAFSSEAEYQDAMTAAKEYYYQKLQDYSSLYSIALTTDSRVVSDAWSTDFSSMIYDTEKWMKAVDEYSNEAILAFREWQSAVTGPEGVTSIVGSSMEGVGEKVQEVTDKSQALADTLTDEVIPTLDKEIDQVQTLTGAYGALRDSIQGVISKYESMMRSINAAYSSGSGSSSSSSGGSSNSSGGSNSGISGSSSGSNGMSGSSNAISGTSGGNSSKNLSTGDSVTVKSTATHFSRDGGNGTKMKSFVPGGSYSVMQIDGNEVLIGKGGVATGWVKKTDLVGFDTGGYTGHWAGSYGKLAFLHEKEMVLNKQDTENLLLSMELLNQILEMIDLQSTSAQLGGLLTSPGFSNHSMQNLEQNVHIEASFPGVQDRNEIEEAFNNLINKASQYAYRK